MVILTFAPYSGDDTCRTRVICMVGVVIWILVHGRVRVMVKVRLWLGLGIGLPLTFVVGAFVAGEMLYNEGLVL